MPVSTATKENGMEKTDSRTKAAIDHVRDAADDAKSRTKAKAQTAIDFSHQAENLGQYKPDQESEGTGSTQAIEAKFITPQDPVIEAANGRRLPAVPVEEAVKLNQLKAQLEDRNPSEIGVNNATTRESKDGAIHGVRPRTGSQQSTDPAAPLREAIPPSRTNPLFPPLPLYGPPTFLRNIQVLSFRISSAILSLCFLMVIVLGAVFTSIPKVARRIWLRATLRDPLAKRPFYEEELRRQKARREANQEWKRRKQHQANQASRTNSADSSHVDVSEEEVYIPLEGGPDPLVPDVAYYARRVGLDCETYFVQTEDGYIIELWHLYNPRSYHRTASSHREAHGPEIFANPDAHEKAPDAPGSQYPNGSKPYPVLLMHGLLQCSGAFCCNDDSSLAFYLAKSGYDVWLGNNRCGFTPRHTTLKYSDPRMWAWNIRQMGVLDLPALISRVLSETGFEKLALIAHSQGTTQTFVSLAKEQRPDIGEKISVFCALAPAAYAGPLIGKMYFKFMRIIGSEMFRVIFGIHAFIPIMMEAHKMLPGTFYGRMGYLVFSFLFNWTDERWERDLKNRMFQFAPVYVSSESMRWWLGRECFATQKCILSTREEAKMEDAEDSDEDSEMEHNGHQPQSGPEQSGTDKHTAPSGERNLKPKQSHNADRARHAWYNEQAPPMAFWVAGADDLVDGPRLLRRFERGREPHVDVVHSKVIEGYEHLDVIWAMDSIEKVASEVKEVIWKTAPDEARKKCRVPKGCETVKPWRRRSQVDGTQSSGNRGEEITVDSTAARWSDEQQRNREKRLEGLEEEDKSTG